MLSPELKKLKEYLEGKRSASEIDADELLNEMKLLENIDVVALTESLGLSKGVCKACGRKL